MAKWGEGDPRWIVEERPDATNVNNWHWTEKNASHWSKEKLKELFSNVVIDDENVGKCQITNVTKIEGEASASSRKAKLIFFYEWNVKMDWTGTIKDGTEEIKGNMEIPNLSEEHKPEDVDINVSVTSNADDAETLKQMLMNKGTEVIRRKIAQYITDLREEFSSGMILPKKGGDNEVPQKTVAPRMTVNSAARVADSTATFKKLEIGDSKMDMGTFTLTQSFKCTADEFYRAMTTVELVEAFTRGPCKLQPKKNGEFVMFGGNVSGEFVDMVPNKRIEQKWRFSSWPIGHYSLVTIDINQKDDCTEVNLTQCSIPQSDLERTRIGWQHYYWESIKKTFGFGAALM